MFYFLSSFPRFFHYKPKQWWVSQGAGVSFFILSGQEAGAHWFSSEAELF
jgi:hypothetical protein